MAPTLGKSQSLPGLAALGISPPERKYFGRKGTFSFKLDSPVDLQLGPSPSEGAIKLAKELQDPGRYFAKSPARSVEVPVHPANLTLPRLAPAWLKHDKQVLRFNGFWQECVGERPEENSRWRSIVIMYYLEDGSISAVEPKAENSGITQGAFIKRHRVRKPDGMGFYGVGDFKLGEDIELYSKIIHLSSCDRYTRWFYAQGGVDIGEDEDIPVNKFEKDYAKRQKAEKGENGVPRSVKEGKVLNELNIGGTRSNVKLEQFLKNDRKVLRFYAYWDDDTKYGNRFYFVIHYFLSDNTVEINEAHCRNSGRDAFPGFMKRGPLYKINHQSCYPGMLTPDPEPYLPKDFMVGGDIRVWGRKVFLYNCDDFTRQFYREYMGVEQGSIDVSEPPPVHTTLAYPPPTGYGSEEDSLGSVLNITPKPPKQDLVKLMTYAGELIRFEGRLVNGLSEDVDRRFILGWFPQDDTTAVWEIQKRNSGFMSGKFKERSICMNPDQNRRFVLQDFYVGAVLTFSSAPFQIIRADEHALLFLEARPDEFPFSNPVAIARKLVPLQSKLGECGDYISPDTLVELAAAEGIDLVDHEVITVIRRFGSESTDGGAPQVMVAALLGLMDSL